MRIRYIILLSVFILSLIVFAGCDLNFDPCANDDNPIACYQKHAVENKDPNYCAKIGADDETKTTKLAKDKCYSMVAQETLEAKYCRFIDAGRSSDEKTTCVISIAKETRDLSSCYILSGKEKQKCILKI